MAFAKKGAWGSVSVAKVIKAHNEEEEQMEQNSTMFLATRESLNKIYRVN